MQKKQKFSYYFYNPITYIGAALAFFTLGCEILLFAIDFTSKNSSVYLGIITYILLPPFLILGLILIPIGARLKRLKVSDGKIENKPKLLYIDPSKSTHRNAIILFIIVTTIFIIMTMIGSYKAFNYTESVQFCGTACHQIMQPEYEVYRQSPHARVKCVECHVGSGAGWYVHYKMAGTRMLIKTLKNSYEKPIPPPVDTLRPAKETCEECHWPGKSFSAIQLKRSYYADDPSKTPSWTIKMLMRVGGEQKGSSGIHAHMNYGNDIYYVAEDPKHQKITWVKTIDKKGQEKIYTTKNSAYKDTLPPSSKIRKMDCMDCHNRPSHHFESPEYLVNLGLSEGKISALIPQIKGKAVDILSKQYESKEQANNKIRKAFIDYYSQKQKEYYKDHKNEINESIDYLLTIYNNNFFPEMKVRWDAYPNNIGHMISLGCFRCHDEEHKTKQGEIISKDCKSCHIITEQGQDGNLQKSTDGVDFQHPFEDDGSWKTMNCSDCHTGGS